MLIKNVLQQLRKFIINSKLDISCVVMKYDMIKCSDGLSTYALPVI